MKKQNLAPSSIVKKGLDNCLAVKDKFPMNSICQHPIPKLLQYHWIAYFDKFVQKMDKMEETREGLNLKINNSVVHSVQKLCVRTLQL